MQELRAIRAVRAIQEMRKVVQQQPTISLKRAESNFA